MTEKQQKGVFFAALVIFLLVCGAVGWFVGRPLVSLAEDPEAFRIWVNSYGLWGKVAYVAIVVLQVVVALIPGEPLELAGGYAFGGLEGTVLALVGIVIGSALVFLLVRRYGVKLVEVFFSKDKIQELSFIRNPKKTRALAFILMMIPGTPKDFLSYFAGLTNLTLWEWLAIVTVARIPSVIGSTLAGGAAGTRSYGLAAITVGITVVFSGAGILYYRYLCKQQREEKSDSEEIRKAS